MADQRKSTARHYSIPMHISERQLQRDLPRSRAFTFMTSQWWTAPFCNVIWTSNTIENNAIGAINNVLNEWSWETTFDALGHTK